MVKHRAFLTGATGTMGLCGMKELLKDVEEMDLVFWSGLPKKQKDAGPL